MQHENHPAGDGEVRRRYPARFLRADLCSLPPRQGSIWFKAMLLAEFVGLMVAFSWSLLRLAGMAS